MAPVGYLAGAWLLELFLELARRTLWDEQRVMFWMDMSQPIKASIGAEGESPFNVAQHAVRAAVERGDPVPIAEWRAVAETDPDPHRRRLRLAWVAFVDAAVKRVYGIDARAVPAFDPAVARDVRVRGKHLLLMWAVRLSNLFPHLVVASLWVLLGVLFL